MKTKKKKQAIKWTRIGLQISSDEKAMLDKYAFENTKSASDVIRDAIRPIIWPDKIQ